MTDYQFCALFSAAHESNYRLEYVADAAQSNIWGNMQEDTLLERIDAVGAIWDVAHTTIRDIRAATGLSQVAFAQRYCIPRRTIEEWEAGRRKCPPYLRLLLAQSVGIYKKPEIN